MEQPSEEAHVTLAETWFATSLALLAAGALSLEAKGAEPPAAQASTREPEAPATPGADAPSAALPNAACRCPGLSPDEEQLLANIRKQHLALLARERAVSEREAAVAKLEADLRGRVSTALSEIERLEEKAGVGPGAEHADAKSVETLVDAVASLSPRKAAPILGGLAPDAALEVLSRLTPEKVSALLARMDASAAAPIVERLAERARSLRTRASSEPRSNPPASRRRGR
jgi:flagellar motility protein MotE (MotC chaperone)